MHRSRFSMFLVLHRGGHLTQKWLVRPELPFHTSITLKLEYQESFKHYSDLETFLSGLPPLPQVYNINKPFCGKLLSMLSIHFREGLGGTKEYSSRKGVLSMLCACSSSSLQLAQKGLLAK